MMQEVTGRLARRFRGLSCCLAMDTARRAVLTGALSLAASAALLGFDLGSDPAAAQWLALATVVLGGPATAGALLAFALIRGDRLAGALGAFGLTFLALVLPRVCPRLLEPLLGQVAQTLELSVVMAALAAGAAGGTLSWALGRLGRRAAAGAVLGAILGAVSMTAALDLPAVQLLLIPAAVVLPSAVDARRRARPAPS